MTVAYAERTPAETAVSVAFLAVTGRSPAPQQEQGLRSAGWTPLALHAVDRLAHRAESEQTALTRLSTAVVHRPEQNAVQRHNAVLLDVAAQWPRAIPLNARLGWLTILATTRDTDVLTDLIGSSYHIIGASTIAQWTARCGAEIAPLAYAAGLSLEEAEGEQADDRSIDRLRTLAALRGMPIEPARLLAEAARAHPWLIA